MKGACFLLGLVLAGCFSPAGRAADPWRLRRNQDWFFAEDNLAYRRYLSLARDGSYHQINQNATATLEVDNGIWEQSADGTVALHSQYGGLRFRALRNGPLTVLLNSTAKRDALPALLTAIQRLLDQSPAAVFAADSADALAVLPAAVLVDKGAESFTREELLALAGQMDRAIRTETTRTYRLAPTRASGGPWLLVLADGTFSAAQVPEICRAYHVPRGAPPPFYFAQVDPATFARRVGRWQLLQPVGGCPAP